MPEQLTPEQEKRIAIMLDYMAIAGAHPSRLIRNQHGQVRLEWAGRAAHATIILRNGDTMPGPARPDSSEQITVLREFGEETR